jgi:hypothetical protein
MKPQYALEISLVLKNKEVKSGKEGKKKLCTAQSEHCTVQIPVKECRNNSLGHAVTFTGSAVVPSLISFCMSPCTLSEEDPHCTYIA